MKIHNKIVKGFKVSAFKDPSTISGEWVVKTDNFSERFDARKFTMGLAIEFMVELEESKVIAERSTFCEKNNLLAS